MGIIRNPFAEPELDLRRPRIPKAPALPRIPGPRGGPAYRPDPRDEMHQTPPPKKTAGRSAFEIGLDLSADLFRR